MLCGIIPRSGSERKYAPGVAARMLKLEGYRRNRTGLMKERAVTISTYAETNISPEAAEAVGYAACRVLPSGETAGLRQMITTVGLIVGIGPDEYRTRFCYPDAASALDAIQSWDGQGDPPGPWIKEKPCGRPNPEFQGIPIAQPR